MRPKKLTKSNEIRSEDNYYDEQDPRGNGDETHRRARARDGERESEGKIDGLIDDIRLVHRLAQV